MIMLYRFTSGLNNRLIDTGNYTRVHERIHIKKAKKTSVELIKEQDGRTKHEYQRFSGFFVQTYRMCARILGNRLALNRASIWSFLLFTLGTIGFEFGVEIFRGDIFFRVTAAILLLATTGSVVSTGILWTVTTLVVVSKASPLVSAASIAGWDTIHLEAVARATD